MKTQKVTLGGWYQRTTLHLTEVYDIFKKGSSRLDLSKRKLLDIKSNLNLVEVTREADYLEYVLAKTKDGIEIRYYEDGLYILELDRKDPKEAEKILKKYYKESFEPAISYLFSLGAPTPKVLANINISHPTVVSLKRKNPRDFEISQKYGSVYSEISTSDVCLYKSHHYIFAVSSKSTKWIDDLVETQIFFREFKDQLERYLNIHRKIWKEITQIKEKGEIKGNEVGEVRSKLESYNKTINLISNRINQMGSYINTRRSIAKDLEIEDEMITLFQYKFETLSDTHGYIKELWKMTSDYLKAAIAVVVEIENKSTNVSIRNLSIITMIGVISGVLGYLSRDQLPEINRWGLIYFTLLIIATYLANKLISRAYKNKKYKLEFGERDKKI